MAACPAAALLRASLEILMLVGMQTSRGANFRMHKRGTTNWKEGGGSNYSACSPQWCCRTESLRKAEKKQPAPPTVLGGGHTLGWWGRRHKFAKIQHTGLGQNPPEEPGLFTQLDLCSLKFLSNARMVMLRELWLVLKPPLSLLSPGWLLCTPSQPAGR